MTNFFEGRSGLGVHQKRKVFELRNQYTLTDEAGGPTGTVEQATQSPIAWLARLVSSLDTMLPVRLVVADGEGQPVLVLDKPWFTWRVTVREPDGRELGTIAKKVRIGKAVYALTSPDGAEVGEVRAEDWRSRNFQVNTPEGTQLGQVTKQWRGLFTEAVTDADTYAVTFGSAATNDQRALTFAGALTVDLIQKQKDAGGGLTNLIPS